MSDELSAGPPAAAASAPPPAVNPTFVNVTLPAPSTQAPILDPPLFAGALSSMKSISAICTLFVAVKCSAANFVVMSFAPVTFVGPALLPSYVHFPPAHVNPP
jgi:hypothetical protein